MGGLLRTVKDRGAWEKIHESEIWDLPEDQCGIIPALRLSYHHLPSHLKRCFAYCSILPKDYEFGEKEIILLWRAEGLLQQKAKSQIKDFDGKCFRDLVSRSIFQVSSNNKSRFVMHDRMNDLAQLVAGEICSKLESDKQHKISYRTRHSSYICSEYDSVKKLEALIKLKCLRVLSLEGYWITELPDFFEQLKHLRYVNLFNTGIKCLPDSLCTLYLLETLILRACRRLERLPLEIGNLKELQYLDISEATIKEMPLGVGKLTNLQSLSNFVLGEGDGHRIGGLRNLSNLKGDFCLSGLENVKGQDAREAKLYEKSGIDRLTLKWRIFDIDTRNKEDEERVLDFLHPQKKLEHLIIESYGGAKFPAWIADSSFQNLLSLKLRNCRYCKSLPSIGRLPLLKDLLISGFNAVHEVGVEFFGENQPNAFASLETLRFEHMPNLKEWDPCEDDEQVSKFPNLRELFIEFCPRLSGRLPSRLHSLEKLVIYECKRLIVSISNFASLRNLKIYQCEELVDSCATEVTSLQRVSLSDISKFSIPAERIMSRFTNSEYFEILVWKELASLWQYGLGLIGHRFITIKNCAQLVSLETEEEEKLQLGKISGIESLTIENCKRLNRLPKVLHALKFLTKMEIIECPSLVSFSENNLPPTLKSLLIQECENLKYLVDDGISNSCILEELEIIWCESLICLSSRGDVLNGLRLLKVDYCPKLTSLFSDSKLPMTLKQLHISHCPGLECVAQDLHGTTGLQSIKLESCGRIKSLPRELDKLSHLQEIELESCSNLVSFEESGLPTATNLRVFSIIDCGNVGTLPKSLVEWGLDRLTSLQRLCISGEGCSDVVSFPKEKTMLPASLTHIRIGYLENLEYMFSEAFQNLSILESLFISDCCKLRALPEKDMLLSLGSLEIWSCPLLKEEYEKGKGRESFKLAHIPFVRIDGIVQQLGEKIRS
ncbi:hypothetical protein PTKIN_Ptkin14bG0161600 [Pterospermum kingtungense]